MENQQTKVRISVTIAPNMLEKLDEMCRAMGMNRPSVIAMAIDRLWKEERFDK